jgi:hypothetical protein
VLATSATASATRAAVSSARWRAAPLAPFRFLTAQDFHALAFDKAGMVAADRQPFTRSCFPDAFAKFWRSFDLDLLPAIMAGELDEASNRLAILAAGQDPFVRDFENRGAAVAIDKHTDPALALARPLNDPHLIPIGQTLRNVEGAAPFLGLRVFLAGWPDAVGLAHLKTSTPGVTSPTTHAAASFDGEVGNFGSYRWYGEEGVGDSSYRGCVGPNAANIAIAQARVSDPVL